ncbi:Rpn family recombination-promoting nuclease/putative transposase [Aneurinibacillus aneurinilyticus]|uniref:Rpn family recombination-promoting nuclease/putative transposase n=1 Tax=Aneurinibacillus aneurinilyticus TaxID=1391 RepID=UPI002E1C61BE|nr:Rpn family recombination-promoting nuclease/putative transposase [Aneurinibacillus aneurinilyticus]
MIVSIVLYNGKQEWTVAQTYKETLNMHELFSDHVLDFSYILLDVNRYTEKELLQVTNVIGTVFLLDQHVDDRELRARLYKLHLIF